MVAAPFQAPAADWAQLIESMTAAHDTPISAQSAAQAWIQAHQPAVDATPRNTLTELARLLQAGVWALRITTSFFEVAQRLPAISSSPIGDGEDFWSRQPPRDLMSFVPEQAAGNLMALQWQPNPRGDSGSFSILWLRGVGRWPLYHLHDLLAAEGIEGPSVVPASATSWRPASPRFHLDVTGEPGPARAQGGQSRAAEEPDVLPPAALPRRATDLHLRHRRQPGRARRCAVHRNRLDLHPRPRSTRVTARAGPPAASRRPPAGPVHPWNAAPTTATGPVSRPAPAMGVQSWVVRLYGASPWVGLDEIGLVAPEKPPQEDHVHRPATAAISARCRP